MMAHLSEPLILPFEICHVLLRQVARGKSVTALENLLSLAQTSKTFCAAFRQNEESLLKEAFESSIHADFRRRVLLMAKGGHGKTKPVKRMATGDGEVENGGELNNSTNDVDQDGSDEHDDGSEDQEEGDASSEGEPEDEDDEDDQPSMVYKARPETFSDLVVNKELYIDACKIYLRLHYLIKLLSTLHLLHQTMRDSESSEFITAIWKERAQK